MSSYGGVGCPQPIVLIGGGIAESLVSKHLAKGVLGVTWTGRNVATVRKILDAM